MTRRHDAAVTLDDAFDLAIFAANLAEWVCVDPTTIAEIALALCLQYRRGNLDNEETRDALSALDLPGEAVVLVGAQPAIISGAHQDAIPLLASLPGDLLLTNDQEG